MGYKRDIAWIIRHIYINYFSDQPASNKKFVLKRYSETIKILIETEIY